MTGEYLIQILHGVGFLTGATLFGMLLAMVLQSAGRDLTRALREDALALVTGILGLAWNLGALILVTHPRANSALLAIAYAAFGLLPAVFVHAAVRSWQGDAHARLAGRWITGIAYALSGGAAFAQLGGAAVSDPAPSRLAFQVLASGFLVLVALMVISSPAEARRSDGFLWMSALALFGISAWHLGHHEPGAEGWPAVVLGHHASIPLVLAILWSDFRFALADIFLKRALAVVVLVTLVAGLYLGLFGAHLGFVGAAPVAPQWVLAALALSAGIALLYPVIRRATGWFVDVVLLRRAEAATLRSEISRRLVACDSAAEILSLMTDSLGSALRARRASWEESAEAVSPGEDLVVPVDRPGPPGVTLSIPTAEAPHYRIAFESLGDGRRILSDDMALLEGAALAAARRLDAVRWLHERCERDLREELVAKLATEAELRALRAQLNPHFLFNALNTLGYLMKASPDRARGTLLDLTKLLRAVLKGSGGDVVTLGQEIDLVESYLAIERARFEERLQLRVEVPVSLRGLPIPPLLVQPLVENAIKHGISPRKDGGEILVKASSTRCDAGGADLALLIEVSDTGVGATERAVASGRARGVGLNNVEKRLRAHYGPGASLSVTSRFGEGTTVTLLLPGDPVHRPVEETEAELARDYR